MNSYGAPQGYGPPTSPGARGYGQTTSPGPVVEASNTYGQASNKSQPTGNGSISYNPIPSASNQQPGAGYHPSTLTVRIYIFTTTKIIQLVVIRFLFYTAT